MKFERAPAVFFIAIFLTVASQTTQTHAQSFGVELHSTLMPVSGGMGGVSIAQPLDPISAIAGNPAALTQYRGTQFTFGGGWAEPTINLEHTGNVLPNITPFSAKSEAEGAALGNVGIVQDLRPLGLPVTIGVGLVAGAGAGLSYRDVAESNGSTATISALEIIPAAGIELTDRLSAGASLWFGNSTLDGPFTGLTGAAFDYALRGTVAMNYKVGCHTRIGVYWQTKQSFNYDDAVRLQLTGPPITFDVVTDIDLDLPENVGIGWAHDGLLCGRLLVAVDVLYKNWDDADLFRVLYDDQWVVQVGGQYKVNERLRLRMGYVFAENATDPNPGISAGGVTPPGGQTAIEYAQALFPAINEHRITFGVGIQNLLPGLDFDLFAGGMFDETQEYGPFTTTSVESYWVGAGMTWKFGAEGNGGGGQNGQNSSSPASG